VAVLAIDVLAQLARVGLTMQMNGECGRLTLGVNRDIMWPDSTVDGRLYNNSTTIQDCRGRCMVSQCEMTVRCGFVTRHRFLESPILLSALPSQANVPSIFDVGDSRQALNPLVPPVDFQDYAKSAM
jgi:hypothetical protein